MIKRVSLLFAVALTIPLPIAAKKKKFDSVSTNNLTVCNNATVKGSLTAGSITTANETVTNNLSVGGTLTVNNVAVSGCTAGTPGVPCLGGALAFASFYFELGAGQNDNPFTIPANTKIIFPRTAVSPVGVTTSNFQDFTLTDAGVYEISWVVNVYVEGNTNDTTELPAQIALYANDVAVPQSFVGGIAAISAVPPLAPGTELYFSLVGLPWAGSILYQAAAGDVISLRAAASNHPTYELTLESGATSPFAGSLNIVRIA